MPVLSVLFTFLLLFVKLCAAQDVTLYCNDPRLATTSNWASSSTCPGNCYLDLTGDFVRLRFDGVHLTINFASVNSSAAIRAQISIDGGNTTVIDTSRATSCLPIIWNSDILSPGSHVVEVTKLVYSSFTYIRSFTYTPIPATSTSTSTRTPSASSSPIIVVKKAKTGVIIGAILGGVAALLIIALLAGFFYMRSRRRQNEARQLAPNVVTQDVGPGVTTPMPMPVGPGWTGGWMPDSPQIQSDDHKNMTGMTTPATFASNTQLLPVSPYPDSGVSSPVSFQSGNRVESGDFGGQVPHLNTVARPVYDPGMPMRYPQYPQYPQ